MIFVISLIAAFIIAVLLSGAIRRLPGLFYALCIIAGVLFAFFSFPGAPRFVSTYIFDLFRRGALGTALFVVVMFIGALPNGSAAMKRMLPIRGYLSIMASILILGHSFFYGKTYFVKMFAPAVAGSRLTPLQTIAMILSILMLVIMIPLFITSFKKIRGSMKPRTWKKLQRFAYVFYGLIYVHIAILLMPHALAGAPGYALSIGVYGLVFCVYLILRLRKSQKVGKWAKMFICVFAVAVAAAVFFTAWKGYTDANAEDTPETAPQETTQDTERDNTHETQPAPEEPRMHDGTYTGKGTGYNGPVEVSIVVEDGVITQVILGDNSEDAMYRDMAVKLFDDVIEKQTHSVDSVSGATSSSVGMKSAIKKAIAASMAAGG